jgi:hypothetical protein
MRFKIGQVVATPGAIQAIEEAKQCLMFFLGMHMTGAWGDLDAHDRKMNLRAVIQGNDRIMSCYLTRNGDKLYIITEHDRSSTTILLADEY